MSGDEKHSSPPGDGAKDRDGLLERIVKRGIESGIGAFSKSEDTLRGVIENLKLPRDVTSVVLEQVDETKKGIYTVVAKELRDFLSTTNFAGDVKKILTGLAFEVKMEVRFKSVDDTVRPDVKADASLKPTRRRAKDDADRARDDADRPRTEAPPPPTRDE
jgi:hypothetical protein